MEIEEIRIDARYRRPVFSDRLTAAILVLSILALGAFALTALHTLHAYERQHIAEARV